MAMSWRCWVVGVVVVAGGATAWAGSAAEAGSLVEELPTLRCLGVRWWIGGDDNANAAVRVAWRKAGQAAWRRGMDLFAVAEGGVGPRKSPVSFSRGVDWPNLIWSQRGS